MKITVLIENTTLRKDLTAEHGLSLYIETAERNILFDAGQTGAFADNAKKLGVDLTKVDLCVLSHGHYDHGGGLGRFLEINDHAPVYLNENAFGDYFSNGKYIGLDPALEGNTRLIPVSDVTELFPGVTLCSCNDLLRPFSFGVFGQTMRQNGTHMDDHYLHEQYLLMEEGRKRVLFSGCSHKGILNIVEWFRPDVLVGGFHFMKLDPEKDIAALETAAEQLLRYPTVYYTGHCTGEAPFAFLKERMGDRLHAVHSGTVIEI